MDMSVLTKVEWICPILKMRRMFGTHFRADLAGFEINDVVNRNKRQNSRQIHVSLHFFPNWRLSHFDTDLLKLTLIPS